MMTEDLPALTVGQVVRVFRGAKGSPIFFVDPATGRYADVPPCTGEFEVGVIRENHAGTDAYRVTVRKRGRELYIDWTGRYWIRLSHEPAPDTGQG